MRLIVLMTLFVVIGARAFAATDACVGCRVSAVTHALRAKGTIDCGRDVPDSVEARARRALANCELRNRGGTHESEVLAAIRDGVAAVEGWICGPTPVARLPRQRAPQVRAPGADAYGFVVFRTTASKC
jgi:hypothetical protein